MGWQWGKFMWPVYSDLSEFSYVPTIYDAELNLDKLYYQSGFGYEDDIKLNNIVRREVEHLKKWAPVINSGTYYVHDREWYLFSDQYITEALDVTAGHHVLGTRNKALTPIFIRNYKRSLQTSELLINKELRYAIRLDADGTMLPPQEGEFIVDTTTEPTETRIQLFANDETISSETQAFQITEDTTSLQLSAFPVSTTNADANNWSVDLDLGVLTRLNPATDGLNGTSVTIVYTPSYVVIYEPEFSSGEVTAETANINPLHVGTNRGFIQITTEILDPFSIELETDLPITNPSNFPSSEYNLDLGNNVARLTATVRNQAGSLLEGIRVFFDWEHAPPGGYGDYTDDPSSITNYNGEAYMSYSAPSTINDIGSYVLKDDITVANGGSTLDIPNIAQTSLDKIYIYAVSSDDTFMGLDFVSLQNYWTAGTGNYFTDELITEAGINTKDYEESYRQYQGQYSLHDFHYPYIRPFELVTDHSGETRGRKTMVFVERNIDGSYLNPNTGVRSDASNAIWEPLKPFSITEGPTTTSIKYSIDLKNTNNDPLDNDRIFQYFVVANRTIKIKAWANNAAGQRIFSNEILLNIMLPDSLNGVYYAEALNSLPSDFIDGLLTSKSEVPDHIDDPFKEEWDDNNPNATTDVTSVSITPDANPAVIPLGFRIANPQGITVASLLDRITFLTKEND